MHTDLSSADGLVQPHSPALDLLARALNEAVMGFLALIALATALGPMVFDVTPDIESVLTVIEWLLVAAFAVEFAVQGLVAADRGAWLRSGWRLVELATILGPVASLLPQVSHMARGSLMLRMLRLGRAVAFGTRAGSSAIRAPRESARGSRVAEAQVRALAEGSDQPVPADWRSVVGWSQDAASGWLHAWNVDDGQFRQVAAAAQLTEEEVARLLHPDAQSRIRTANRISTLMLRVPVVADGPALAVHRDPVFMIVGPRGVLTATAGSVDLQSAVSAASYREVLPDHPFQARVVGAVLELVRERNEQLARRFDDRVHALEVVESGATGHAFLQDTFILRRQLSAAALDLWHLTDVVRSLADGKATLAGIDLKDEKHVDDLLAEFVSLIERVNKAREEVTALIELHINVKSFEMNTLLKLLAIVSFLGLIPSVAGGLLGMNVMGNPWPVTLGQVAFAIAMAMATALYVFAVKGWLK